MKKCMRCLEDKPASEFNKAAANKDGLDSCCRQCKSRAAKEWNEKNKERARKNKKAWREKNPDKIKEYAGRDRSRTYGITAEQYNNLLDQQNNCCAICGGVNENGKALSVDHDHSCCKGANSCGKCVRKLLCDACNWGLGHFKDNPVFLRVAAEYVEDHRQ